MSKSTCPLKLPLSTKKAAQRLAKEDGVSLNQWIAAAVAEKVGVVGTAAEFFKIRAKGGDGERVDEISSTSPPRETRAGRLEALDFALFPRQKPAPLRNPQECGARPDLGHSGARRNSSIQIGGDEVAYLVIGRGTVPHAALGIEEKFLHHVFGMGVGEFGDLAGFGIEAADHVHFV